MQKWYVIQVCTGKEEAARLLIEQVVGKDLLEECFVPRFQVNKKHQGQWITRTHVLFPGYVIAVTSHASQLEAELRRVPAFTKLLHSNDIFVPLGRDEVAFINAFMHKGSRVVSVSTAVMEGDRVIVREGPLINKAVEIVSVNRRKQTAQVRIRIFGRDIETKVGLSVISRK